MKVSKSKMGANLVPGDRESHHRQPGPSVFGNNGGEVNISGRSERGAVDVASGAVEAILKGSKASPAEANFIRAPLLARSRRFQ